MDFVEVIEQARALLRSKGRMTYRTLKRQFALDDEALADLKDELIEAERVAVDENGKVLVWTRSDTREETASQPPLSRPPDTSSPAPAPHPEREAPAGERRQLTVMFCDLVGSTALSEQLDPEDLHTIVRAYQDACRLVIERYDGHIVQYLGDGILVYFGYPAAHEDDAIRGVRAGLDILAALPTLKLAHPIQARIGIHTGPVVIGSVGGGEHTEQLALGETPNIAARVQGTATPNTVVISTDTYHLVQGFFVCDDLGPQELKGLSSPLTLYQVTGEDEAQNRFDVSVRQGLTPLVGREEEVELLLRRWERAKAGNGQVVLLSGEAGIGKSRLVQMLRDHSHNEPHLSILCRCSPFYQNSALYPIIARMQQVLQFTKDDTAETKLNKLIQSLEPVDMTDEETVALFATLLSLPLPDNHPPLSYSPQKQKEKTLQAMGTWLHKTAVQQTVRLEFEDLHWADSSTLELLGLLIDQASDTRMLLLLTFRPEFRPPWPAQAHTLQMYLNRLPQQDIAAMVEQVAGKALPEEVVQQLLTKSDGVPLYIEEMTKNLLESGLLTETDGRYELTGPLPEMAIPSSLQDSFAARLDRLAPVRELAQIGAVLGRDFTYDLIQAVSRMDDLKLQEGLGQLRNAEILFQRGVPPDASYTFKHALLQDTAYQSLLKSQRQQFHARTAEELEKQFPETKDMQPELLAHHYMEASLAEQAIPYWQQAGQQAIERFGNQEAISHLRQGLELLKTLPETRERDQQELILQITLGGPLVMTKGYAGPEVGAVLARAQELCRQGGEMPERFSVLAGLFNFSIVRAEHRSARDLAKQVLALAQQGHDTAPRLLAHFLRGFASYHLGDFDAAYADLEQAAVPYNPHLYHALAALYGQPVTEVATLSWWGLTRWQHGYPDQATKQIQVALSLARELSHPYALSYVMVSFEWLYLYLRDWPHAQEWAEELLTLSTKQGFAQWLGAGHIYRGVALAHQGQGAEGLGQIQQGIVMLRATGAEIYLPYFLAQQAEVQGIVGHPEDGLPLLSEAVAQIDKTEERWWEAEVHRLTGALLLQQSPDNIDEAETAFQRSLEVSRRQHAKSLELRAAASLARLWQEQGKQQQAHELLAPVYDWFTEGFDTADLKDAKSLLEELA